MVALDKENGQKDEKVLCNVVVKVIVLTCDGGNEQPIIGLDGQALL